MKVIFLDFDGVINDIHHRIPLVNPLFVGNLKAVIEVTGAKVVVISSHKDDPWFVDPLVQMGVEIWDYTPDVRVKLEERRELEILYYLKQHSEIQDFVIIEDDFVMQKLYDHQVFIEYSGGFTEDFIEPTVRILNGFLGFYPEEYDRSETFMERMNRLFPCVFLEDEVKEKKLKNKR